VKATVTTNHADASLARSLETALKADNLAAPKPLRIMSRVTGKQMILTITGAQDIESLLSTIDDLLLCLIAADALTSTTEWRRRKKRGKC